jgi:hypothetical protein
MVLHDASFPCSGESIDRGDEEASVSQGSETIERL